MDSNTTSNASCSSWLPFDGNEFYEQNFVDANNPRMIRWKSGKKVDPRLIEMLHLFEEFYVEKKELFKKIFPDVHQTFVDLFKQIGEGLPKRNEAKVHVMQRSLSIGSPTIRQQVEESELSLYKFKVRTPVLIGPPPVTQGGGGGGGGQTIRSNTNATSNAIR